MWRSIGQEGPIEDVGLRVGEDKARCWAIDSAIGPWSWCRIVPRRQPWSDNSLSSAFVTYLITFLLFMCVYTCMSRKTELVEYCTKFAKTMNTLMTKLFNNSWEPGICGPWGRTPPMPGSESEIESRGQEGWQTVVWCERSIVEKKERRGPGRRVWTRSEGRQSTLYNSLKTALYTWVTHSGGGSSPSVSFSWKCPPTLGDPSRKCPHRCRQR